MYKDTDIDLKGKAQTCADNLLEKKTPFNNIMFFMSPFSCVF